MGLKTANVELVALGHGQCAGTSFSGETLGKSHKFRFADHDVVIQLPKVRFEHGSVVPKGRNSHLVQRSTSYGDSGSLSTIFFRVSYLKIKIQIAGHQEVPVSTLKHRSTQIPSEISSVTNALDCLASNYDRMLFDVFRHWVSIARWSTNQQRLGLRDFEPYNRNELSSPRISLRKNNFDIWQTARIGSVLRSSMITSSDWDHIRSILKSNSSPPIWFELLCEANDRFARYDFSGSALSSVFACEAVARTIFQRLAGTPSNEAASELIEKISVRSIIQRWKSLTGLKADGDVHKIFDLRNDLAHSRISGNVDRETAQSAIKTATTFVEKADEWWFEHLKIPNPRMKLRSVP